MTLSRFVAVLFASITLGICGCGPSSPTAKPSTTIGDEAVELHKARVAAIRARTDELGKKLDDVRARAGKATGEEKAKLEGRVKDGAAALETLKKKIGDFEKTGADGKLTPETVAVRKEVDAALDSLLKAVE